MFTGHFTIEPLEIQLKNKIPMTTGTSWCFGNEWQV
jgi:hypothetical protein